MFKNMKIGMRLGIGFGFVVLTLIIVALMSVMRLAEQCCQVAFSGLRWLRLEII